MAINLQIDKFGAQFSAFVEFASAQKHENYIACIEGQKPGRGVPGPNGQPRSIAAKTWDGRGQFLRGRDSRAVNNEVRTLFLRTILGVCGVRSVAELPPGVRAVLKADDDETFGTAAESVRRRTGLLMSILSQFTASSVTTAFQSAIERPGLTYQLAGNSAGPAERPRLTASAGV